MRSDLNQPVLINLGDLGAPGYHEVTQLEMQLLYSGAVELLDTHDSHEHVLMLQATEQSLIQHAITGGIIDSQWIAAAVMAKAVRGILFGEIPDCIFHSD